MFQAFTGYSSSIIFFASLYADEINVYGDRETLDYAQRQVAANGRTIPISIFGSRPDDHLPDMRSGRMTIFWT